jgi:hypothetical protein
MGSVSRLEEICANDVAATMATAAAKAALRQTRERLTMPAGDDRHVCAAKRGRPIAEITSNPPGSGSSWLAGRRFPALTAGSSAGAPLYTLVESKIHFLFFHFIL